MARPRKNLPPAKTYQLPIRMTEELYNLLTCDAAAAGMSRGEYIRQLIINRHPASRLEIVYNDPRILKALGDIGKIGSNLNQIAHQLNSGDAFSNRMCDQLQDLMTQLYQMRNEIRTMAGEYRGNS